MSGYQRIIEAFQIFEKYDHFKNVHAEHDELYAGPDPSVVSEEELVKLDELGWIADEENGCFYMFC